MIWKFVRKMWKEATRARKAPNHNSPHQNTHSDVYANMANGMQQDIHRNLADELLAYSLKTRQEAEESLRMYHSLTPRQRQVTLLICRNYTNPQIAEELYISVNSVKEHVARIRKRFGVHSKQEIRRLLQYWEGSLEE